MQDKLPTTKISFCSFLGETYSLNSNNNSLFSIVANYKSTVKSLLAIKQNQNIMTEELFKEQIRKQAKFRDLLNYVLSGFVLLIGLFLFYRFFHLKTKINDLFHLVYPTVFFCLLGGYGIWRIPKDYKLIKVKSDQSAEQKTQIIEAYISTLKVNAYAMENGVYNFTHVNKYWNSIEVFIAFNNEFYFLNARAANYGINGIIDFGLTSRASKKLAKYFMSKAGRY